MSDKVEYIMSIYSDLNSLLSRWKYVSELVDIGIEKFSPSFIFLDSIFCKDVENNNHYLSELKNLLGFIPENKIDSSFSKNLEKLAKKSQIHKIHIIPNLWNPAMLNILHDRFLNQVFVDSKVNTHLFLIKALLEREIDIFYMINDLSDAEFEYYLSFLKKDKTTIVIKDKGSIKDKIVLKYLQKSGWKVGVMLGENSDIITYYLMGCTIFIFKLNVLHLTNDDKFLREKENIKEKISKVKEVDKLFEDFHLQNGLFEPDADGVSPDLRLSLVARSNIRKDTILTEDKIAIKFPFRGISPFLMDKIINKKACYELEEDTGITFGVIE